MKHTPRQGPPPPPNRRAARSAVAARPALVALAGLAAGATVVAGLAPVSPASAGTTQGAAALLNPGFENGLDGWTVTSTTGATTAAKTESPGRDSSTGRLTHWSDAAYQVTTAQQVDGLASGWWTASAWVKSGGLDATRLELQCDAAKAGPGKGPKPPKGGAVSSSVSSVSSVALSGTLQDDSWVRVATSVQVTGGSCTVAVVTEGPAGAWANVDDVSLDPGRVTRPVRGGDLSGLAKNEANGARYFTSSGKPADPVRLLGDAGMNLARLKVWVNPADGFNTTEQVVETAKRAKAAGMQIMVDFHYSDTWADPGKQFVPAAWAGHTPEQLAQDVADHTAAVLKALKRKGITPEYVQVGNEINSGMLWPWGQTWDVDTSDDVTGAQWDTLAAFLKAGAAAVEANSPKTQVILHLTNINTGVGGLTWWLDEVAARGVPFDLVGLSYYGYWHGSLADLQEAVTAVSARYDKDVMIVETAYPFTLADDTPAWENIIDTESELVQGYPATPAGQASAFLAVQNAVAAAPGGRGIGVVYWEPAWTSVAGNGWDPADPSSGNAWENQAVFDFDGQLLAPAAAAFAADAADKRGGKP